LLKEQGLIIEVGNNIKFTKKFEEISNALFEILDYDLYKTPPHISIANGNR